MRQCQCKQSSISDPNQLQFPGFETRFKDKYLEGYESGFNWDANWMPGGPWVYTGRNQIMRENSKIEAEQWLSGFSDGLNERLNTNVHFAEWWNRNKGKGLTSQGVSIDEVRYTVPEQNNNEN